jgi:hypothetical protein
MRPAIGVPALSQIEIASVTSIYLEGVREWCRSGASTQAGPALSQSPIDAPVPVTFPRDRIANEPGTRVEAINADLGGEWERSR